MPFFVKKEKQKVHETVRFLVIALSKFTSKKRCKIFKKPKLNKKVGRESLGEKLESNS